MVEAPSQIRDAIAQTRAEVAETIHALGERVDVTRHVAEKLAGETDHLKHAAAKVADLGQHALESATGQIKATTPRQRLLVPVLLAVGVGLSALAILLAKRRREVPQPPPEWEITD